MAELYLIDCVRDQKHREQQQTLIAGLEELLEQAKNGELKGICYATVAASGHDVWLRALKDDTCGFHELVGASALLSQAMLQSAREDVS